MSRRSMWLTNNTHRLVSSRFGPSWPERTSRSGKPANPPDSPVPADAQVFRVALRPQAPALSLGIEPHPRPDTPPAVSRIGHSARREGTAAAVEEELAAIPEDGCNSFRHPESKFAMSGLGVPPPCRVLQAAGIIQRPAFLVVKTANSILDGIGQRSTASTVVAWTLSSASQARSLHSVGANMGSRLARTKNSRRA